MFKEETDIDSLIRRACQEIGKELFVDNKDIKKYIENNLSDILELIKNAVKQNTLDCLFITQRFIEN